MKHLQRVFCDSCQTEFSASYRDGELHVYDPLRNEHSVDCPSCGCSTFSSIGGIPRYEPDDEGLEYLVEITAEDAQ